MRSKGRQRRPGKPQRRDAKNRSVAGKEKLDAWMKNGEREARVLGGL